MGSSQEERFIVLLEEGEQEVEGLSALLELARGSRLFPTTRIRRVGQEKWVLAERIPALRLHFSADSWDDLVGIRGEAEAQVEAATEPVDLPMEALEPMETDEAPTQAVEDLPRDALTPVGSPQMVIHSDNRRKRRRKTGRGATPEPVLRPPEGPIPTSGELIDFPVGVSLEAGHVDGSNPVLEALQNLEMKREARPPDGPVRWGYLAFFSLFMFGVAGGVVWYIRSAAQASHVEVAEEPSIQTIEAEVEPDRYGQIEEELREGLSRRKKMHDVSRGPQIEKIEQDQKVEDAIEEDLLLYMEVAPGVQVMADVLSHMNGSDRMPKELQLQITLTTTRSRLDRDLGAVAMVVGRFAADFNLEVIRSMGTSNDFKVAMKVMDEGGVARQYLVDWREARRFYRRGLTMEDFVATVSGS